MRNWEDGRTIVEGRETNAEWGIRNAEDGRMNLGVVSLNLCLIFKLIV